MSFTWNGGVLYYMTKLLNQKYKIKQTVIFLVDARFPDRNFDYNIDKNAMRMQVSMTSITLFGQGPMILILCSSMTFKFRDTVMAKLSKNSVCRF